MMGNLMHQLTLMADTADLDADQVQHLLADQDDLVRSTVQRSTTEAFRIVRFAGFADLFADLTSANAIGLKWCTWQQRAQIGKALNDAYQVTFDQAAAA